MEDKIDNLINLDPEMDYRSYRFGMTNLILDDGEARDDKKASHSEFISKAKNIKITKNWERSKNG